MVNPVVVTILEVAGEAITILLLVPHIQELAVMEEDIPTAATEEAMEVPEGLDILEEVKYLDIV